MFKKTGFALALALASGVACAGVPAGTIGIGIAHSGEGNNTIFVPITLGGGVWVEPFVSYANEDPIDDNAGAEVTAINAGAGLFATFYRTAKTRAYFGGRLGVNYIKVEDTNGDETDETGLFVQPTLGFGYMPVDNLMIGAEAFLTYKNGDINGVETLSTGTQLFARYYFAP